jgi:hypothetical protein
MNFDVWLSDEFIARIKAQFDGIGLQLKSVPPNCIGCIAILDTSKQQICIETHF